MYVCMHVCIVSALSGKDEKDQKRKDSLVVLAARMNNEVPASR